MLLCFCCFFTAIVFGQPNNKGITYKNVANDDTTSNPRQVIPFDDGWRFLLGDNAAAKEVAFDDSQWRLLNLPHDWSIEGPVESATKRRQEYRLFYSWHWLVPQKFCNA